MFDKLQLELVGTHFISVKYRYVCIGICGVGGTSTRLLQTYIFRIVHEMVLKNRVMGKFYKMIPTLLVGFLNSIKLLRFF